MPAERHRNLILALIYEPNAQDRAPVTIARTRNADVLEFVAAAVVTESERRADTLSDLDPGLGAINKEEASRLRRLLAHLLPGSSLADESVATVPQALLH